MISPVSVAERLILEWVTDGDSPLGRREKITPNLLALAGFFTFISSGLFVYAAYLWLTGVYPPEMVAALTGCVALFLAALFALGAAGVMYQKQRQRQHLRAEVKRALHSAFEFLDEEFGEPVQDNPKSSVALASVAGYAVGDRLRDNFPFVKSGGNGGHNRD